MATSPSALSAELERALLREIADTWATLNWMHFREQLRAPVFELSDAEGRLGRWDPEHRVLELSRNLTVDRPWPEVVEVLKHEMAHQYVSEVLAGGDGRPHGDAFRQTCARLGIDSRASGVSAPGDAEPAAESDSQRVLRRVAKLLALAESDSQHEAEAAMAAAQRLMLKHNLALVDVKRKQSYRHAHLGTPTGRVSEADRLLALILQEHFFVEVIWVPAYRAKEGKRGSLLEICGAAHNIELASYAYSFLRNAGEGLWREHKRKHAISGNRDRRSFIAGVMTGFYQKLEGEKRKHADQGLVWVADADLHAFYRTRHPRVHRTRFTSSHRAEAHGHGREAGRQLVMHKPVSNTGNEAGPRRLLGPSSRG